MTFFVPNLVFYEVEEIKKGILFLLYKIEATKYQMEKYKSILYLGAVAALLSIAVPHLAIAESSLDKSFVKSKIELIEEHKINEDDEMKEKLSEGKIVSIVSKEEVEARREKSIEKINSLTLNEEQKKVALETVQKISSLSDFDSFEIEQNKISDDNIRIKKEEEERARLEEEKKKAQTLANDGIPDFDSNGRLIEVGMNQSPLAEQVITLLLKIPGHMNGAQYHIDTGLDNLIDQLSDAEAVHVIHRIEGPGFGQTGDGLAGSDSSYTDKIFVQNQVNRRFQGNIKNLLKYWGTNTQYGGY